MPCQDFSVKSSEGKYLTYRSKPSSSAIPAITLLLTNALRINYFHSEFIASIYRIPSIDLQSMLDNSRTNNGYK